MNNFILIAVCILAGQFARRRKLLPEQSHKGINFWIITVALPAVSFKYLPKLVFHRDMWLAAISPVIVFLGALVFIGMYARLRRLDKLTKNTLQLISGLSNTSFVGFPLIIAYFGEPLLSIAVICDQVTFALLSSAGIVLAINAHGQGHIGVTKVLKRLFTFPPLLGCLAALTIPRLVDVSPFDPLFATLAGTVAPLALFSIGLQLSFTGWREEIRTISIVLIYKLIIAPALIFVLLLLTGIRGPVANVSLFEAAMPVLLSAAIVAEDYQLKSKQVSLAIGISILMGLGTTALWYQVLKAI